MKKNLIFKFCSRHWIIFIIWSIIYSLLPPNWPKIIFHRELGPSILNTLQESIFKFQSNPLNWLLDGPPFGFHLWYMATAPLTAGFIYYLSRYKMNWIVAILGFSSIALMAFLVPSQLSGTSLWATNTKIGILTALPCMIFGWFYSLRQRSAWDTTVAFSVIMVILYYGSFIQEITPPSLAGIFLGMAVFVFLLSFPKIPFGQFWCQLGRLSLCAYLIHIALRSIIFSLSAKLPNSYTPILVLILAALSLITAFFISKIPRLKFIGGL